MHKWTLSFAFLALAGCAVGPNYTRPAITAPPAFRSAPADSGNAAKALADTKWFDLFDDKVLNALVHEALAQNWDLAIASERVLQARAQLGIQESNLFPTVSGNAQLSAARNSTIGTFRLPEGFTNSATVTQTGFGLSWELDIWGRLRRLNESARAQYLGSLDARSAVITTLVADVTTSYFRLRELDLELEIAIKTRETAENSLRLINARHNRGAATGLDVSQGQQLLYTATSQIAAFERLREQTENALSLLLGRNPGEIQRGKPLDAFTTPAQVPPGLPSALLERRPDIRQAEQNLISANAEIGAAKALYFPQITLTGFLGVQSRALTSLFTGPARQFSFAPAAAVPIFNAGRVKAGVRFTEAVQREALLNYQRSIQNAFREVSDSLVGYRRNSEQRTQQELLVKTLSDSARLSRLRYQGGLDSYLQVLDADRNLFQNQIILAQVRREELVAVIQLYRALGGGWQ